MATTKGGETIVRRGGTMRRTRRRTVWTPALRERFITALAESCNVKWAAEQADIAPSSAYRHRAANAAFRAAWGAVLEQAYDRLEMELLRRALHGTEKIVTNPRGEETRTLEYPNSVALGLLSNHARAVAEQRAAETRRPRKADADEAMARFMARLAEMRARIEAGDRHADAVEDGMAAGGAAILIEGEVQR